MDIFVVLVLVVVASVESDIRIGYQYQPPATSYEVPLKSVGNLNADRKYYHVEKQNYPTGNLPLKDPSLLKTQVAGDGSLDGGGSLQFNNLVSSTPSTFSQTQVGYHDSLNGDLVSSIHSTFPKIDERHSHEINNIVSSTPSSGQRQEALIDKQSFQFVSTTPASVLQTPIHEAGPFANVEYTQQRDNVPVFDRDHSLRNHGSHSQKTEVERHLYFFSAPDEPEEIRPRIAAPAVTPKKNIKVLFIKAPTYKFGPLQIPAQVQNEDKTLVYVLVKKPDEPEAVVLPASEPSKPAKPEVYFIKYKMEKEAQDAISNIQAGGKGVPLQSVSGLELEGGALDNLAPRISASTSGGVESHSELVNIHPSTSSPTVENSRFIPRISSGLLSTRDFSHTNINMESVYTRLHQSNAENTPTLTPDADKQFSTIKTLQVDHDQVQGYSSIATANAVTLPTNRFQNAEEFGPHREYGLPN